MAEEESLEVWQLIHFILEATGKEDVACEGLFAVWRSDSRRE